MAIEAHTFIVTQQPTDPLKWVISESFWGRFFTPRRIKGMRSILGRGVVGNKKKRSKSPVTAGYWIKNTSASNNLSVIWKLFNSTMGYGLTLCKRFHKCKKCGLKDYKLAECLSKKKKKWRCEKRSTEVTVQHVEIVEVASLAKENIFCQFMRLYLCFLAFPRPNTFSNFRLVNASRPPLINSPFPLKSTR